MESQFSIVLTIPGLFLLERRIICIAMSQINPLWEHWLRCAPLFPLVAGRGGILKVPQSPDFEGYPKWVYDYGQLAKEKWRLSTRIWGSKFYPRGALLVAFGNFPEDCRIVLSRSFLLVSVPTWGCLVIHWCRSSAARPNPPKVVYCYLPVCLVHGVESFVCATGVAENFPSKGPLHVVYPWIAFVDEGGLSLALSAMVEKITRSPARIRIALHFVSSKRHISVWQSDAPSCIPYVGSLNQII